MSQQIPRILVVDDDHAIRTMVERVLTREKFVVESARDGHEAIEKLTQNDYGTMLLDLMMPRVDGLTVLRWLEESKPDSRQWVIVMTANMTGAEEAAGAKPIYTVVPKPFDIRQLVQHVRSCIGSDGAPAPAESAAGALEETLQAPQPAPGV